RHPRWPVLLPTGQRRLYQYAVSFWLARSRRPGARGASSQPPGLEGMKVLVTGATGFIGRHLVRYLTAQGHGVRALVRRPDPSLLADGAELAVGDLTRADAVSAAVQGMEAILHLAAVRDRWGIAPSEFQQV